MSITNRPLTRESVLEAHEIVKPYIHKTPVLTNSTLNKLASTPRTKEELLKYGNPDTLPADLGLDSWVPAKPKIRLWFKCENLQRIGAFKVRGAFHAIGRLLQEEEEGKAGGWERAKGVVTHSSGNHAQALALAARENGIPAYIVMPSISPSTKIEATKGYGANVIFSGSTSVERETVCAQVMAETGARLVPPYDHRDISIGQGTVGLELQEQAAAQMVAEAVGGQSGEDNARKRRGLDAIITPCGGGGMLSGVALSCQGTGIKVFGAEPSFQGGDDCRRSLLLARDHSPPPDAPPVSIVRTLTIADGLRTPVGRVPWSVISARNPKLVEEMFAVSEEGIKVAMQLVLERMKVVVEPSAVVGLAALLWDEGLRRRIEGEAGEDGWDVGVVFSGGNIGVQRIGELFGNA